MCIKRYVIIRNYLFVSQFVIEFVDVFVAVAIYLYICFFLFCAISSYDLKISKNCVDYDVEQL